MLKNIYPDEIRLVKFVIIIVEDINEKEDVIVGMVNELKNKFKEQIDEDLIEVPFFENVCVLGYFASERMVPRS